MTWRGARILSTGSSWDGALELTVTTDPSTAPDGSTEAPRTLRALAYPALVGPTVVGDHVLLNTTALDRGLGTGGYALVVAVLPSDDQQVARASVPDGPGHLVKARYTPHQTMVLGIDEQESPHHETLEDADDLDAMPVVVADLHSALPAIIAGARHHAEVLGRTQPRIVYVMTDGGALPAWFSRTVSTLCQTGWTDATITVGQAYGGDHEAVTVHTGLLAARHVLDADLAVVAQGPGNLGTGTRWGFSGVAAGEAVNAAATLGGRPVASLRVSGADPRPRHQGISHHSLTAYGRVALLRADVPVPGFGQVADSFAETDHDPHALEATVREQALTLASGTARHTLVDVEATPALAEALEGSPVRLSTMGRGTAQDPAAFLAAAVAGQHAVSLLA